MIIVKLVFGIGPEPLNTVDVIVVTVDQGLGVVDPPVFPELFQGVVAFEGVGKKDRAFSGFRTDNLHEGWSRERRDDSGINLSITLQEAKNDTLPRRSPAFPSLSSFTEIGFVNLNISRQSFSL